MIGLFISKPGKNVLTADDKHLAFNSQKNVWKIHREVKVAFTANNQTKTLAHGLDHTPAFISFERVSGQSYYRWTNQNDFSDSEKISMLGNNGDQRSVLILKDFGR